MVCETVDRFGLLDAEDDEMRLRCKREGESRQLYITGRQAAKLSSTPPAESTIMANKQTRTRGWRGRACVPMTMAGQQGNFQADGPHRIAYRQSVAERTGTGGGPRIHRIITLLLENVTEDQTVRWRLRDMMMARGGQSGAAGWRWQSCRAVLEPMRWTLRNSSTCAL